MIKANYFMDVIYQKRPLLSIDTGATLCILLFYYFFLVLTHQPLCSTLNYINTRRKACELHCRAE